MKTDKENVDQAELAKFEPLASRWWDPHSEFKPLHDINPLRLDFIDQRVPVNGRRVVDVGCGGGLLAEGLALRGAAVTGIDMAEAALAVAQLHRRESGAEVEYRRATAEQLATQAAGQYDIVTCLEMLEHVPDPRSTVLACAQLVKPGGAVFLSTINRNPKAWAFAIVGAEYVLGLLPRGTHEYAKLIRPSELEAWARAAELAVTELTGLHYNPLTRRYRLGPGLDVNYLAYCQRPDG